MYQRYSEQLVWRLFILPETYQRKVEKDMNQKNPLWSSVSILVVAVLIVTAFVRGDWAVPLLIVPFVVWGLWAFWTQLFPGLRRRCELYLQKRQAQAIEEARKAEGLRNAKKAEQALAAVPESEMAKALLRHINHRISTQLKGMYPDARWNWVTPNPTLLALQGGIGRIRVYGVPDYNYADVELDPCGKLGCSLVKALTPQGAEAPSPEPPNRQAMDPQEWYERDGKKVLKAMVADLDSRGHNRLAIKEDGKVFVQPVDGGEETEEGTLLHFPPRDCWPKLVTVLEQAGFAAAAREDYVAVVW